MVVPASRHFGKLGVDAGFEGEEERGLAPGSAQDLDVHLSQLGGCFGHWGRVWWGTPLVEIKGVPRGVDEAQGKRLCKGKKHSIGSCLDWGTHTAIPAPALLQHSAFYPF